jgi:CheY-like chemotaxis protein
VSATLLLADDSPTIHRLVELTFAHENVSVVSVSDGAAAVAQIDAVRPDVVLADVGMPRLTGYEVASHIKRTPALQHIPVLLLSGAFDPIDADRARECGSEGSLVKPFEPQQLIARVNELLASRRHESKASGGGASSGASARPVEIPLTAGTPHGTSLATPSAAPAKEPLTLPIPLMATDLVPAASPSVPAEPAVGAVPSGRGLDRELDSLNSQFGSWDLPERPRPLGEGTLTAADVAPPKGVPAQASGAASRVSLASAFSALLAAEQARPPAAPAGATVLSEAAVEDAVRRVLARMTEESVHRIVLETAERLIREEIEKIKANPA